MPQKFEQIAPIIEDAGDTVVLVVGHAWGAMVGAAFLGVPAWFISGKPVEFGIAAALGGLAGLAWFHRQVTK